MTSTKKKIKRARVAQALRWNVAASYGGQGVQFLSHLVLARLLAPEHFGLVTMATVFISLIRRMRAMGLPTVIVQRESISDSFLATVFYLNYAICLLIVGIAWVAAPLPARFFGAPELVSIIRVYSLTMIISGMEMVPIALLTRRMEFEKLAARQLAGFVISGVACIALALAGFGVWALVWGSVIGHTIRSLLIILLTRWFPKGRFSFADLKSVMQFGTGMIANNLVKFFSQRSSDIAIGAMMGKAALGYWGFAARIMRLPQQMIRRVLMRVLFPMLSRAKSDDAQFRKTYLRASGAIAFVTFPAMIGLIVIADLFVKVVVGPQWEPAIPIIMILATVGMVESVSLYDQLLLANGRSDYLAYASTIKGIVTLVSLLIGAQWGVVGAAASYAIATAVVALPLHMLAFSVQDSVRVSQVAAVMCKYLALSLIMAASCLVARMLLAQVGINSLIVLVVTVCTGVASYIVVALMVRPSAMYDLLSLVPSFKRARKSSQAA